MAALLGFTLSFSSLARAAPPYRANTAGVTGASRDAETYGDFLRLIWVSPGTQVTYLGRNDSSVKNLRAFFIATTFVQPAVTVDQYVALVGNYYPSGQDLVVMRCKPSSDQRQTANPILASRPNVFTTIVSDFQGAGYECGMPLYPGPGVRQLRDLRPAAYQADRSELRMAKGKAE